MCFSAAGSFFAAGTLTAIGCAAFTREVPPPSRPALAIPFLFAAQQAAEGVVWKTMGTTGSALHAASVNTFLFFAICVWPVWMPWAALHVEKIPWRRRRIAGLFALGIVTAVVGAAYLAGFHNTVVVTDGSLRYRLAPTTRVTGTIFLLAYCASAVLPFFLAWERWMKFFGAALAVSLLAASVIWNLTYLSVWCFFAAFLSIIVVAGATHAKGPARLAHA
ncbi:MAG TPA: DUF6629 family protein [bacterium]|nr:DUF6629 family protein [bacterium]